jgi:hypothetical protein
MRGACRSSPSACGMTSLPTGLSSCLVPWLSCHPKKARKRMSRSSVGGTLNDRSSIVRFQQAQGERRESGATVASLGGRDMFTAGARNAKQVRDAGLVKEKGARRRGGELEESRPAILVRLTRGCSRGLSRLQPTSDETVTAWELQRQTGGGLPPCLLDAVDGGPTSSSAHMHPSPGKHLPSFASRSQPRTLTSPPVSM